MSEHVKRYKKIADKRILKANTSAFKLRRRFLQKLRTLLQNKKSIIEGITYEKNIGLLKMPALQNIEQFAKNNESYLKDEETTIVFFYLETSGSGINCDILQIAMKCGIFKFNKYIYPRRYIPSQAYQVHNITFEEGNLYVHSKQVEALQKQIVLQDMLLYLKSFKKPCTLVAHNSFLDAAKLIHLIQETFLFQEFKAVIAGFTDILTLLKKNST